MSTVAPAGTGVDLAGLSIRLVEPVWMASIRFFDPLGDFVKGLAGKVGGPLPGPLQVFRYTGEPGGALLGSRLTIASRSPNETLMLCNQAGVVAALEEFAAGRSDGCVVNQTGAYRVWEIAGDRAPDFLARLGSAPPPSLGEASVSRIAELTVMSLGVEAGRTLLLVDRLYSDHLDGWFRETFADFNGIIVPPDFTSRRSFP